MSDAEKTILVRDSRSLILGIRSDYRHGLPSGYYSSAEDR